MQIRVLPAVARVVEGEPDALKESIYGALQRLERGERIPMPLCKSLSSIERGLCELRFSHKAGEYWVFYYIKVKEAIYVIHAMQKKRQKIGRHTIDLLKSRIRSIL